MLRRAGFVCRSCLLALSRPRLTPPPPPQLAHARKHTRSVSTLDDPFARLAEAQKNDLNLNNASLLPNDFSGTVPTPPPPDEPEPPPRGRKRWSISNSSKQPQPNPTRGEGKSGLRHRKLELERGDDAVDQGDEGAGDEGNGLIKPPSKNFKFRRIKRKPLYNQRQRMVNYLAGVGSMTSGEKAHLTRKFVKWRKEFITKVWPHTQPITTQEERAKLQLGDPPESVDFPIPPDVPSIREGWFKWVESKRRDRWPKLITTTMKFWPHRTHEVLEATFEEGVTPYYAVADVISFIVRWAIPGTKGNWSVDPRIQRWGAERKIARSALPHLLLHILESSTPGSQRFRQWTLYRIINLADADTAASLNQALGNHQHLLHPYTRFQIGERLAKDVRLKYMALEHLEEMVATNKADANSKYSHALATSILSFPDPDKGNELLAQMRTELSERILRLGLTPNIYHYTVMIRSLCANGDFKTAWQIYEMLTEHNIAPDLYLYSALLNGAKLTGKLELVDRVVAHLPTMAFGSRVIRNDLLGAVLTAAIMEARAKGYKPPRIIPAFPAMLAFYARFYKLEKLQRIIPINLDEIVANSEEYHEMRRANWRFIRLWEQFILPRVPKGDKLLDPSSDTLAIMILGFLKSNESKYQIMAFYSHFQMLLGQGDMVACELCRYNGSAIHDFVLKAALEWEGMLRVSLDILSDMLQGKASRDRFLEEWPAYIKKQEESGMGGERRGGVKDWPLPLARKLNLGLVPVYEESAVGTMDKYNLNPAPSVYSWSIILNGAMYHRQLEQGVRIMKLMREHGVEPNDVTWNTLIRGFARLQRTAATVTSMKRMEEHGYKADEFTMRAFGSLIDKEGALRMMDGMLEDMRREREQKGLDGGDSGLLREAIVSSDSIDDAGEGARPSSRDEVVEYDRILAAHQRQGGADDVEYIDWEKQAGEWENMNVEVDEEQEFVQRAKREVAEVVDNVDLSLPPVPPSPPPPPPPPPPPSLPPLMEDESELMDGPQSIPKPKIKYF